MKGFGLRDEVQLGEEKVVTEEQEKVLHVERACEEGEEEVLHVERQRDKRDR
jgi:hypothetical protein